MVSPSDLFIFCDCVQIVRLSDLLMFCECVCDLVLRWCACLTSSYVVSVCVTLC